MPQVPSSPVRLLTLVLSALVLLSALVVAGAAVTNDPKPGWFMLMFEVVIATAGVLGVLIGLGRFRDGPGLALACLAGTVGVGSFLGFLATRQLHGQPTEPLLIGRGLAAAAYGLLATWAVFERRPARSLRPFGAGAVLGLGALGLIGAAWRFWPSLQSLNALLMVAVVVIGGLIVVGLTAASVHLIIAAYGAGRTDSTAVPSTGSGASNGSADPRAA